MVGGEEWYGIPQLLKHVVYRLLLLLLLLGVASCTRYGAMGEGVPHSHGRLVYGRMAICR